MEWSTLPGALGGGAFDAPGDWDGLVMEGENRTETPTGRPRPKHRCVSACAALIASVARGWSNSANGAGWVWGDGDRRWVRHLLFGEEVHAAEKDVHLWQAQASIGPSAWMTTSGTRQPVAATPPSACWCCRVVQVGLWKSLLLQ